MKEASLRGLEGVITDMEITEMQSHQTAETSTGTEFASDEEMMHRLEGLEAEILTIFDIDQEASEGGGAVISPSETTPSTSIDASDTRSHDQAVTSHDQAVMSYDQTVTSHDHITTATRSRDLVDGHCTTPASKSHDQAVESHDQVGTAPVSPGVSRGTQFPSATDILRTSAQEDEKREATE